jgi:hypothetical protein
MNYRVYVQLTPEDNPELELPGPISTRRGISVTGRFGDLPDHEETLRIELRGAIRAIEHYLSQWQARKIEFDQDEVYMSVAHQAAAMLDVKGGFAILNDALMDKGFRLAAWLDGTELQ